MTKKRARAERARNVQAPSTDVQSEPKKSSHEAATLREAIALYFGDKERIVAEILDAANRLALGNALPGARDAFDVIRIAVAYLSEQDAGAPLDALSRLEGHFRGGYRPGDWAELIRWLHQTLSAALERHEAAQGLPLSVATLSGPKRMNARDYEILRLTRRLNDGITKLAPIVNNQSRLSDVGVRRVMGWHTAEDLRELRLKKPPRRSVTGRVADVIQQLEAWRCQASRRLRKKDWEISEANLRREAIGEVDDALRHRASKPKKPPAGS